MRAIRAALAGMRVEAVDRNVKDSRPEIGVDQLSRQLEPIGQARLRIQNFRLVVLADLLQPPAAGISIDRGALHEIKHTVARRAGRHAFDDRLLLLLVGLTGRRELQLEIFERRDRRYPSGRPRQGEPRHLIVVRHMKRRRLQAAQRLADPAFV